MRWLIRFFICIGVLCVPLTTSAFLTNIKGANIQDDRLGERCSPPDLDLTLIASVQRFGSGDWNDQACLFGEQICYIAEDVNGVASGLSGEFTEFQLNAHRVSVFFPDYDLSAVVVDDVIESGTPCNDVSDILACMKPSSVEKSENLDAFYFIDGQVAALPNRAAVCMVLPNAIGRDDVNVQCLNKTTGITIVNVWGAVNESTNKFYLSIPQTNEVEVHRFSITASTITDDSLSRTTTIVGSAPVQSKMSSLDTNGKLYFSGRNNDIYSIDQDLLTDGSLFIASAGTGTMKSMYFDNTSSTLYLCGSTRIEKYDLSGSLLVSSPAFDCRDVQVDQVTGRVYATSSAGVLRRFHPSTLVAEQSLLLSGATDPVSGLEIDGANNRLYAITEFTGTYIRRFYKVRTCMD